MDYIQEIKLGMNKGRIGESGEDSLTKNQKVLNPSTLRSSKVTFSVNKRHYSTTPIPNHKKQFITDQTIFSQWLAGLIDGDGHFNKLC